jgi:hypothetical protein
MQLAFDSRRGSLHHHLRHVEVVAHLRSDLLQQPRGPTDPTGGRHSLCNTSTFAMRSQGVSPLRPLSHDPSSEPCLPEVPAPLPPTEIPPPDTPGPDIAPPGPDLPEIPSDPLPPEIPVPPHRAIGDRPKQTP